MKVEDFKPQTQAQNSASNPSQNAQLGRPTTSTTNNRKGHPSNSSKIAIQASSQPLRDRTNNSSITANSASSQISMTGAHEDLFKTLGMGTNERNHINLVANTLIQQIKAQVLAALGQSAVETTARIETPRGTYIHTQCMPI